VAQLYHHCAPRSEVGTVARALMRLLHNHRYCTCDGVIVREFIVLRTAAILTGV